MKNKPHEHIPFFSMKGLGVVLVILFVAELALILLSWILSATMMEGVRSLLSSEGIRWFVGGFANMQTSHLLVWLILIMMALGAFQRSGVVTFLSSKEHTYREKVALRVALVFLVIYLGVIALLILPPHAILLSVTGSLFHSPFSRSLVPLTTFGIILFSVTFGMMSGRLNTLSDILDALSFGISKGAPLFILYILLMQFYQSLCFVFG